MIPQYNHLKIEPKWQKYWKDQQLNEVKEDESASKAKRRYILDMFPYPSGAGLHVGHPEGYTATDIYARYLRMKGYQVLHPMGWDSFGLPAENYAIKQKVHPKESTYKNIDNFCRQIKSLGFSYDWSREIATCDPEYYKWTQWLFLLLYKNGLAYRKKAPVNWCGDCKTVLAREQVIEGKCERCKNQVIQKELKQWFFKITDYAERLLDGLDKIDWPEPIKLMQSNWIGRSEGAEIEFETKDKSQKSKVNSTSQKLKVFTTRADTIFGSTYMVVAPEHDIISNLKSQISNLKEIERYIDQSRHKTELERTDLAKEKTGVEIKGIKAINPASGEEIPIWVADYVLMSYGTGAIMAVPAHDERDFEFARKYKLPVRQVIQPKDRCQNDAVCYTGEGTLINSQYSVKISFNGISSEEAKNKIVEWLAQKGLSKKSIQYKLRDWLISRQRYWGAPIPIIYCKSCGEIQEDFLKNIGWLLRNVTKDNFETINQSKAVGRFSKEINKIVIGHGSLVYLNSYVLGKLRGWFRKFKGHSELPLDFYFLLPRVAYAPSAVYQDNRNPAVYHFALRLPRHHFNVVIDIERIKGRNEISTLFIARDKYLQKLKVIKKESSRGPATSPSCLPNLSNRDGGSGISTLCKNSYKYYKCFGKKSQEILYKKAVKPIPVPDDQLPIELPNDVDFRPKGESPLERSKAFHKVKCPGCGSSKARRESDTMDTFVCSSWYYFRYTDPHNANEFASKDKIKYWLPVDTYVGGAEHAVMHLLYARFFCKVLYDQGMIDFEEPFKKLINQGLILAEDGRKMSKSLCNVINPDDIVYEYGADTLRMYEMFMGPLEDAKPWSTKSIKGIRRFLEKVYFIMQKSKIKNQNVIQNLKLKNIKLDRLLHKTVKKVTEDIESFKFNTAISQLMILVNEMQKYDQLPIINCQLLIILLAPFAPHLAEELWSQLGYKESIFRQKWTEYDRNLIKEKTNKIIVQVNGKVRDAIEVPIEIKQDEILAQARNSQKVQKWLKGQKIKKEIYVPNRIVNFVV